MKNLFLIAAIVISISISSNAQKTLTNSDLSLEKGLFLDKKNNSLYTGKIVTYYPNGQVEVLVYIKHGKKTGKMITYYDSGNKRVLTYEDENFTNFGKVRIWNENGSKALKGNWKNGKLYKKGQEIPFTGIITSYYNDGKIYETSEFKEGQWHGKQTRRDRNGNIIFECIFKYNKIVDCPIYSKK